MKIHQLSLFLENRPGTLTEAARVLAQAGINVLTLSLADTREYGILRLIVRDWTRAQKALEDAGFVVNVTEVTAIEVEDRPGGLAAILESLESARVNIEYMYAFTFHTGDKALLVFRFDNPDAAIACLRARGVNVLDSIELFARAEA